MLIASHDLTEIEAAVDLLQTAATLDPGFAEAWAELVRAYREMHWGSGRPEIVPLMEEAADHLLQLASDLPETHIFEVDAGSSRDEGALRLGDRSCGLVRL